MNIWAYVKRIKSSIQNNRKQQKKYTENVSYIFFLWWREKEKFWIKMKSTTAQKYKLYEFFV